MVVFKTLLLSVCRIWGLECRFKNSQQQTPTSGMVRVLSTCGDEQAAGVMDVGKYMC